MGNYVGNYKGVCGTYVQLAYKKNEQITKIYKVNKFQTYK